LPEAQDYMIGVRKKSRKEKESRERDLTKFDVIVATSGMLACRNAVRYSPW
jgi:Cft2 family RNA processing exonuclease